MGERILPLGIIDFEEFTEEVYKEHDFLYENGKFYMYRNMPLKCLKVIANRFRVYVDFGFKGNSRYANEKSDYYVYDMKQKTLLVPKMQDYGSIVYTLEKRADEETPLAEKLAPFTDPNKLLVLIIQNMIQQDEWQFEQAENGDIVAQNQVEKKVFADGEKLRKWILEKGEDY